MFLVVWRIFMVGRWLVIWVWLVVYIGLVVRFRFMIGLWNIIRIWVIVRLRFMVDVFIIVRIWIVDRLWMMIRLRVMVAQWIWIMVRMRLMKTRWCLLVKRFLVSFVGFLMLLVMWFFNDIFRLRIMITSMIIFCGPIIVTMEIWWFRVGVGWKGWLHSIFRVNVICEVIKSLAGVQVGSFVVIWSIVLCWHLCSIRLWIIGFLLIWF